MVYGGLGVSLVLTALGAVLAWAVNVEAEGFSINTIGLILFVVGLIGIVLSALAGFGGTTVVRDREPRADVTVVER